MTSLMLAKIIKFFRDRPLADLAALLTPARPELAPVPVRRAAPTRR